MCLQRNVLGKGEREWSGLDEITALTLSPDFGACFENKCVSQAFSVE